jgi:hypothetical protein
MPKKGSLPDYSHEHFTKGKAKELEQWFGFKPYFDLHTALNDTAEWLDMFRNPGDELPSVRRKELDTLQERAKDFHESLRTLGHRASADITMNDPQVPQGRVDVSALRMDVQILMRAITKARRNLPAVQSGRRPKDAELLEAIREVKTGHCLPLPTDTPACSRKSSREMDP